MIKADLEDLKLEYWLRQRNADRIAWVTKEGKVIPIKDMTDAHLVNTINMIERNADRYNEFLEALGSIGDKDFT